MFEALELMKKGGAWLGRVRDWMQRRKRNGETVTWGSDEALVPPVTVRELEEVAALSAAEVVRESLSEMLRQIREAGWSVAVHNDYRQNGIACTFWLFTHPNGKWLKGEGRTDEQAVGAVLRGIMEDRTAKA